MNIKIARSVLVRGYHGRSGRIYMIGSKDGVFTGCVALPKYGGCGMTPGIESSSLTRAALILKSMCLVPSGFLKVEAFYVPSLKKTHNPMQQHNYGDFSKNFPNVPIIMKDKYGVSCVIYKSNRTRRWPKVTVVDDIKT